MKVIITGVDGFLGKKLFSHLEKVHETYGVSRKRFNPLEKIFLADLFDKKESKKLIESIRPEVLVHTASLVDVELCEKDKKLAYKTNVGITKTLAMICEQLKIKLIYFSSDYVFSGKEGNYKPNSKKSPINYYGETKSLGEDVILENLDNFVVIRPTILYGFNDYSDKKNFCLEIINKLKNNQGVILDNKRLKFPLLIDDVAINLEEIIKKDYKGISHMSGKDEVTKYQMGLKIAEVFNLPKEKITGKNLNESNRPYKVRLSKCMPNVRSFEDGLKLIKKQMEKIMYKK